MGAGVDPKEVVALIDGPWRRNEERYPDKSIRASSPEESRDSVSERGGSLAGSFYDRLFPAYEMDRRLLAEIGVDSDRADPDLDFKFARAS